MPAPVSTVTRRAAATRPLAAASPLVAAGAVDGRSSGEGGAPSFGSAVMASQCRADSRRFHSGVWGTCLVRKILTLYLKALHIMKGEANEHASPGNVRVRHP